MTMQQFLDSAPKGGTKIKRGKRVLTLADHGGPMPPFVLLDADGKEATLSAEEWPANDWQVQP